MDFNLDDSVGYLINIVAGKLKNELNRRFTAFDITPEQWAVLNRLWEKDGVTQKNLAERTFKDQPNIGRILNKLEKKGLIRRCADTEDRRVIIVFITKEGQELKKELIPIAAEVLNIVQKDISEADIKVLETVLKRILKNL